MYAVKAYAIKSSPDFRGNVNAAGGYSLQIMNIFIFCEFFH